jgi:hypothetical protein
MYVNLRARSKGRNLAWQCDGHETQKVAQRRSLLGDAEGHALAKDYCLSTTGGGPSALSVRCKV